jgi:hypothetical protein
VIEAGGVPGDQALPSIPEPAGFPGINRIRRASERGAIMAEQDTTIGAEHRKRASVLLVVAWALWWHRWIPAFLVAAVVSWAILHRRLEGTLGRRLARLWRRVWPPRTIALIPLLLGGTLAYWASDEPITPKVLPIALNIVALSLIVFRNWWTWLAHPHSVRTQDARGGPAGRLA